MPTLTFISSFKSDSGLVLSAKDIRDLYLTGFEGFSDKLLQLEDSTIEFYIKDAQTQIENLLDIKLKKQEYIDNLHFQNDDWRYWNFISTTYPVSCVKSLTGFLGTTQQVTYPKDWLVAKKYGDEKFNHRRVYMVPVQGGATTSGQVSYAGTIPQLGYMGAKSIPYYWKLTYVTGFDNVPADIISAIGKFASIPALLNLGDLVLGRPGISSGSISIDGLSQSLGSGMSGSSTAFGGRIKAYVDDLTQRLIPSMKSAYKGILFASM